MSRPIAFVDIETDGLHPQRRAWEVALIRRDGDSITQWQGFLPIDLHRADPQALAIGGFWERHPTGRRLTVRPPIPGDVLDLRHAAEQVLRMTHEATIVGAVPSFDTEVLSRLLRSQGLVPTWHHRLRCVETLAAGSLGRELGGLSDVMAELGLGRDPAAVHTAMGDASDAMRVWDHLMARPS